MEPGGGRGPGREKLSRDCPTAQKRLASKKNVKEHACNYAVRHLLRTGSTYRISESETPAWVRGSRERFNGRRAQARAALGP